MRSLGWRVAVAVAALAAQPRAGAAVDMAMGADPCGNVTRCGDCVATEASTPSGPGGGRSDMCLWCSVLNVCVAPGGKPSAGCNPNECVRAPRGGEFANCTQTAGDEGVVCDGYVPPPPRPPPPEGIWDSRCSCTDYCAYKCGNNATAPSTLTLYRLTPFNSPGLANKDSGDAAGDVEFALSRRDIAADCRANPNGERCFLAGQNIYGRFRVAYDGVPGPYQFCNPTQGTDGKPNVSAFACCSSFDDDAPGTCNAPTEASSFSPYDPLCSCPRNNVSVGRVSKALMTKTYWSNKTSYSTILGGLWFSTPANGECGPGQTPGKGKPGQCTWKTVEATYKNTSCVDGRLDAVVERRGRACFSGCPPKSSANYTSCYLACYLATLDGNSSSTPPVPPMTRDELVQPWVTALEETDPSKGGCPPCRGDPPYRPGDCP